jgi:hypothetical protein
MQYSEKDLANLIESVEKEFMADLAKAEETLAKSEPAVEAAPAAQAETKVEAKTEELAKSEDKKEEKAHAEDHDYDEKDHEELNKMYKSMSAKELGYHKAAIEKCGEMSMAKSEEKVEQKVEVKAEATPNPELELLKSEQASLKAENESLKKSLDALVEGLNKFVKKSAPQGKAITEVAALAKSEGGSEEKSLSKSEVTERLAKKASDPALSKTDREKINDFYLKNTSIETISHLLK